MESAKNESEEVVNKAINIVVINTAIVILFVLPVSFVPILNVIAEFYYKSFEMRYIHPAFGRFYSSLFFNGFYGQISEFADFLFVFSISIQPFIYKRFDKKFQIAFDRIFHKKQQSPNIINSTNTTK